MQRRREGPVRFALIGCGRIAKNHIQPLSEQPDADLVAICDLVPERTQPWADRFGLRSYTNYHDMLRREQVEVVSILTPSGMHPVHAMDIMRRYRTHVVIEKPMALALSDLNAMTTVARESGVKIFPVYQNRYNKAVQRVRRDLLSGALGKPVLGTVRVRWARGPAYYARDPWRGTWAMDGGALTNQGIHYIDLLQYLLGDIESVTAITATALVNVEVEDTCVATARFANGALGVIEVTTAARPHDFEASISVLSEHGAAVLGGIAANRLETYTLDPSAQESDSQEFPDAYGYGHWPFFADVITDLKGGPSHPISVEEGARAIGLLNAMYRSAEDRREVRLDEGAISQRLGRPAAALASLYTTPPPDAKA